jgi:hypothetical protein
MRSRFQSSVLVLVVVLMLVAPTAILFAAPQSAPHDCCGQRETVRGPVQSPQCCVVSAPHAPQPLGPAASDLSLATAGASQHCTELLATGMFISSAPDNLAPSPPRYGSVLRI